MNLGLALQIPRETIQPSEAFAGVLITQLNKGEASSGASPSHKTPKQSHMHIITQQSVKTSSSSSTRHETLPASKTSLVAGLQPQHCPSASGRPDSSSFRQSSERRLDGSNCFQKAGSWSRPREKKRPPAHFAHQPVAHSQIEALHSLI